MDLEEARRRFAEARVGRLATVRPEGGPHVVPVVFALDGGTVWFAVDEKPKRHRRLQRLANLEADPRASVLVDAYDEDWRRLWWVRADGRARIVPTGPDLERAIELLARKYPPYAERRPPGPAVAIEVDRWAWWPRDPSTAPRPTGG
ncbi:MAG TPA: TIGR03668 family PPOX class F420-dependent oxidoreductase [Actinomycetota bacterium]|nr:TIGR03668 family PPOX class F420-dependent oxidoreductase [Actinomycetota bacterium]